MSTKTQNRPNLGRSAQSKKFIPRNDNLLESLRDIGGSAGDAIKKDLFEGIPQDIMRQLFGGGERSSIKASGDIRPGESLELKAVWEENREENKKLRLQLAHERKLHEEERTVIQKKSQELKVELHALSSEVVQLAKTTQGLARETEIAAVQAPANPGIYHIIFFEKLREFIQSFRKKIESASTWMQSYNQRAARRKTFWGQVGRSGAKRLLSQEDYIQRSAG